jgi:ATPase subunit of ABC transporter with duplicated ATPase domains
MIQKPNFLVLDEPTNNLDLEAINALNISLQKYDGTLLLVTHDEDVLDEVATRVWNFKDGKIEDFKGTYEDFQHSSEQKAIAPKATAQKR